MRADKSRVPVPRAAAAVLAAFLALLPVRSRAQTTLPDAAAAYQFTGRTVERVQIVGNPTVPSSVIRNVIRTRAGSKYDPATVEEDYQRVFGLRKFSNVEAQVEPTSTGGVVVVFVVTEQKLIRKITFHGNVKIGSADLMKIADLKVGEAIDSFRISTAKQLIANAYRDKNFPYTRVDVPTDPLTQRGELIFEIVEGPRVWVRNIRFLGAKSFTTDELNRQIKTGTWFPIFASGRFDPQQVDEDMGALRRFYADHGFFDIRVGRKLIFSPDQSNLQIDFIIDEGLRYVVDRIAFQGNVKLTEAQLRSGLNLVPGRTYDQETVQRDVKEIVRHYSPLGYIYIAPGPQNSVDPDYLLVNPQTVFLPQPGRVELLYRIREGKPFRLGRIRVKGNAKSQDKLVLREFRDFSPGNVYDSAAVDDAVERLRALPFFETVTVTPIGDDPNVRDLLVAVTEKRTASFNIGAGVSSNGGLSGNIVYTQRNFDITNIPDDWRDILSDRSFTGAGQGFRASFSPGTIYTSADLQFSEPWLFDQPYQFIEDVYLRDAIRENYTDRRIGDEVTFGKYLDYQNTVKATLRAEEVDIFAIQDERFRPTEILEGRGTHFLTSTRFEYQRDTTNPGLVASRGTVTTAGVELFGTLGGDYDFQRFGVGWSGYHTLAKDLLDRPTVLETRFNVGFITGDSVFFERFYEGDLGSVKGFRYRGISPRSGRGDDPVGGDFSYSGSIAVSFPIYQNTFRGVFFTDFGDVESDVRFGVTRVSVGPGIRFSLPILGSAPLSIYLGIPIVKDRHDDTQIISFSFGGLLQ